MLQLSTWVKLSSGHLVPRRMLPCFSLGTMVYADGGLDRLHKFHSFGKESAKYHGGVNFKSHKSWPILKNRSNYQLCEAARSNPISLIKYLFQTTCLICILVFPGLSIGPRKVHCHIMN